MGSMNGAEVAGTDEIKFWIMNWGSHALGLEPESLREEIRAEAEVMVEKYTETVKKAERPLNARAWPFLSDWIDA